MLGYLGVAGTVHVGLQLPYLVSGGLLGLALVVAGSALLVLQALGRQAASAPAGDDGPVGDGVVLVATGARRFHRAGCIFVQGKGVRRLKHRTAAARGLQPCAVCDHAQRG